MAGLLSSHNKILRQKTGSITYCIVPQLTTHSQSLPMCLTIQRQCSTCKRVHASNVAAQTTKRRSCKRRQEHYNIFSHTKTHLGASTDLSMVKILQADKNIIIMISHTRDMFFKEGKNIITSSHTMKHIPGESTYFYGKFLQVDKITS